MSERAIYDSYEEEESGDLVLRVRIGELVLEKRVSRLHPEARPTFASIEAELRAEISVVKESLYV